MTASEPAKHASRRAPTRLATSPCGTEALAKQLLKRGVRPNVVVPGPFRTPLPAHGGQPPETVMKFGAESQDRPAATPLHRGFEADRLGWGELGRVVVPIRCTQSRVRILHDPVDDALVHVEVLRGELFHGAPPIVAVPEAKGDLAKPDPSL